MAITPEGHLLIQEDRETTTGYGARLSDRNFLDGSRHSLYYQRNGMISKLLVSYQRLSYTMRTTSFSYRKYTPMANIVFFFFLGCLFMAEGWRSSLQFWLLKLRLGIVWVFISYHLRRLASLFPCIMRWRRWYFLFLITWAKYSSLRVLKAVSRVLPMCILWYWQILSLTSMLVLFRIQEFFLHDDALSFALFVICIFSTMLLEGLRSVQHYWSNILVLSLRRIFMIFNMMESFSNTDHPSFFLV